MKYVCVGQPKTGTKTISKIFQLLDFEVNSNPLCVNENDDFILLDNNISYYTNDNIRKCRNIIKTFDAFHDYPYSFNYKYINEKFPDSKFILTMRNGDEWFNSLFHYQHIENVVNKQVLKKLYGYENILLENKEDVISKYHEYNKNIINYFSDKPGKLLIINLNFENKAKLEGFLQRKFNFEIPHENKQNYSTSK